MTWEAFLPSVDGTDGNIWIGMALLTLVITIWIYKHVGLYLKATADLLSIITYFMTFGLVSCVQRISWYFNGVQDHNLLSENGGAYEDCVQIMEILMRGKVSSMNYPQPCDFIGLHQHFTHPCTLLNPRVTLYCVTLTHAYLVEVPEEVDAHSSKTSPFMYMAQHTHATKLYCMPLCHFHRLAQEVGDPKVPVLLISSTGRCGSTLVIQMLENLPGTRCMSEPDVTTNVCLMSRARQLPREEIKHLVQSIVRMLCKEHPGDQRIVIKTRFNCSTELDTMLEVFPEFKHLYLYRNMGHVLNSYYKFLHRDVMVNIAEKIYNSYLLTTFAPWIRHLYFHFIAGDTSKSRLSGVMKHTSHSGFVAALVGSCVVEFQKLVNERGLDIPTLHYDELMRCPLEVTTNLFQVLDLPSHYVQISLSAMQHDTQEGTILSNMANSYNKKMPGSDVKDSNLILSMLGLPDMNQRLVLGNPVEHNDF